jgi:AbrB family looped-hinge helix DNA binding protein
MHSSRMTVKGQVTIPKDVREHMGLKPGDQVEFIPGPGRTVTVNPRNLPVSAIFGILKDRPRKRKEPMTVEEMEELLAAQWAKHGMRGLAK